MKLQKRFAAVLLCAVMALAALTACSGGSVPTKLEWANSRTKQYFDAKGVTPQEFTLTADITVSGQKAGLKFAVKGKQAGYETAADHKLRVDADGNVYLIGSRGSNKEWEWWQYPAGSQSAESYAHSIRACWGYFTLPTDQNVGSISAGKYKKDDKTYDTETLKVYQENVYATYTYCYDGNELSFILVEPIVGMENIELKPVADEAVLAIPPDYRVIND